MMIIIILCSFLCFHYFNVYLLDDVIRLGAWILKDIIIRGGIKTFRDYFDSTPTDGSTGMRVLWGLTVTIIRRFVTTSTGTFAISS